MRAPASAHCWRVKGAHHGAARVARPGAACIDNSSSPKCMLIISQWRSRSAKQRCRAAAGRDGSSGGMTMDEDNDSSVAPGATRFLPASARRVLCAPATAAATDLSFSTSRGRGKSAHPNPTSGNNGAARNGSNGSGSDSDPDAHEQHNDLRDMSPEMAALAAAVMQRLRGSRSPSNSDGGSGSPPASQSASQPLSARVGGDNEEEEEGGDHLNAAGSKWQMSGTGDGDGAGGREDVALLKQQLQEMREALEDAQRDRLEAQARAQQAELRSQAAHDKLVQAQEMASALNKRYNERCSELDALKGNGGDNSNSSTNSSSSGVGWGLASSATLGQALGWGGNGAAAGGGSARDEELSKQVEELQAQLDDMDYRLGWALRDLRAHQLVLRAQGELSLHLSGLPPGLQQQVFDQVDSGAELLGDGGSATVHAVHINGEQLAVKVMPLYDINTARPYHFRDICTTFLRHHRSPYIELPLHTFLRLKDDEVEGTQYFLYTIWPRRHMDVDQLLCARELDHEEIMTVMHHTVLALLDLAKARMAHADVKPPNVLVMLGADGRVCSAHLTDFGSVQFVAPGQDAAPSIWDGQLAWNWPPEQRDWVHLEACDAWGVALLFSCMKVQNPSKPDVTEVLQDLYGVSAEEFERVRDEQLLPELPTDPPEMRSLTRLMRRCVARDPKQRPGIQELAGAITVLREQMQLERARRR